MPEWKSFTFGEDGEAVPEAMPAPAAPSPAMEADEYAAKWGTEVSEVSIARIENVLEGDGLPHGSSEFIAVTQL
ncbi:MAG: histidine kinase, partial [Actinomyces sp.]|nr:histidine kinase [Actinomyces sp.]